MTLKMPRPQFRLRSLFILAAVRQSGWRFHRKAGREVVCGRIPQPEEHPMTRVNAFGQTPKQSLVALAIIAGGTWLLYECGTPFYPASGIAFGVVMSIVGSNYLARIQRQGWRDRHPLPEPPKKPQT
jgi:hypothetical protein